MFPESDIRLGFWRFLAERATDTRTGFDVSCGSGVLFHLEMNRDVTRQDLERITPTELAASENEITDSDGSTVGYATLQDALLAYLIYRVSQTGSPTSLPAFGFQYDYATWLRTVVLVMEDALQDPSRLTVHMPVDEDGEYRSQTGLDKVKIHTMRIDGSWDCLSRDTFDTVKEHFTGAG